MTIYLEGEVESEGDGKRERFSMEEAGVNLLLLEHDTEPGPCLERNQGGTDCVREAVVEMKGKREERERGAGGKDTEERETETDTDTDIWA